ncbi:uncharacterized protein LOC111197562 [Astyanax mexicanus]|uniref:uncharacterized protein LOC111197562 n=1 Tax=Astyanax mexicanus TaxID=7994 RepID=UPI0020CAA463|nr:uncharacterized protein LOC111197562 [Astyanax mexicanus]
MACHQKIVLRVFLTEGDIRKVTLLEKPASVGDLVVCLKEILELQYNFSLQFEDPDFDRALVNLTDMSELQDKATIRVIPMVDLMPVDACEVLDDSASTADTVILPPSSLDRTKQWPETFEIPNFPVDIEYRLRQGNLVYMNDGTCLKLTKELKHGILEKLAETIFEFKAYPNNNEYEQVAAALIMKHPCLTEKGSHTGWAGWKNSLKFKLGNYRTKRRKAGCPDVSVNGGKRSLNHPDLEPSRKNIKKPKKCELNFLPSFPEGHDHSSLEAARKVLLDEMQKRTPNASVLKQKMDLTFALRRKEVVESKPVIRDVVERWPALFLENQVSSITMYFHYTVLFIIFNVNLYSFQKQN